MVSEASLAAAGFLPEDGSGAVVGLQDLAELESACLSTAGGDVVLFNFNTCQVEHPESWAGSLSSGFLVICLYVYVMSTLILHRVGGCSWSASAASTAA